MGWEEPWWRLGVFAVRPLHSILMALDFLSDKQLHVHLAAVLSRRKFKQISPRMKGQEIYPLRRWPLEYPDSDVKSTPRLICAIALHFYFTIHFLHCCPFVYPLEIKKVATPHLLYLFS